MHAYLPSGKSFCLAGWIISHCDQARTESLGRIKPGEEKGILVLIALPQREAAIKLGHTISQVLGDLLPPGEVRASKTQSKKIICTDETKVIWLTLAKKNSKW